MSRCEKLRARLGEAVADELSEELREHLPGCPACREALARHAAVREAAQVLATTAPPPALLERLHALPRFAAPCENALDLLGDALAGMLPVAERSAFLRHLQECGSCRATWEALATLREVGRASEAPPRLRAAAALPPRQLLAVRRRHGVFDVRLAVAAAYLFAALTVLLAGGPAKLTDTGGARIAAVATYGRAAVANRLASYSWRVREQVSSASGWVSATVSEAWQQLAALFSGRRENQSEKHNV